MLGEYALKKGYVHRVTHTHVEMYEKKVACRENLNTAINFFG